jgi:cytochrome c-type biogenesis protein
MQDSGIRSGVRNRILLNSLFFILGFSLVFILLGASATVIGRFLQQESRTITKIAGVIIIILGIHMTGIVKIPFLNYEKRFHTQTKRMSLLSAFVVGLAFAFGWTPCIGPILSSILVLASQQQTVGQGMILLIAYSLGLGIPFFLAGVSITVFFGVFNRFKRYLHIVEIAGGIVLIGVGILILTNWLTVLSGYFARWFPFLNDIG